jgi:hypothetical protein
VGNFNLNILMSGEDFALNCLSSRSYRTNPTFTRFHLPIATLATHYVIFLACYSLGWIDDSLLKASLALD